MSTIVNPVRPGLLLGDRPERRPRKERSAVDQRVGTWFAGRKSRSLSMGRFASLLERMEDHERSLAAPGSNEFRIQVRALSRNLTLNGVTEDLALQAFASVRSATCQLLGIRLHPEQLFAGWAMLHGCFAEMQTGEGKTLTAALPAIVMALARTPVHIVTVNDYLVRRDSEQLEPLYQLFGLQVARVTEESSPSDRRLAYAADIVYCTNKQLVFDYLRDLQSLGERRAGLKGRLGSLLSLNPPRPLMRGLCFAIVDEADSSLIDDARTPLILAQPASGNRDMATEAAVALSIARGLHEDADFHLQDGSRTARLTDTGRDALRTLAERLNGVWRFERYRNELVQQALSALHLFRPDRDYLIKDDKILLIDESTGRVLPDRKLQHGLHRMLEVKEKCAVTEENEVVAAISFQRFFSRYHHLTGMSGTLAEVRGELRHVYDLEVVQVPCHRSCQRILDHPLVLPDRETQLHRAIEEVASRHGAGQPVLVGTRTVEMSERFSVLLKDKGIRHQLLNARQDAEEAAIVAEAGRAHAVTVATNMAGRGTDIPLDDEARTLGGLHVINLEVNESRRVDRQLFGRSARQGDPGSAQAIVSLEDELVRGALPRKALQLVALGIRRLPIEGAWLSRATVRCSQWVCERRHRTQRLRIYNGSEALNRRLAVGGDMD